MANPRRQVLERPQTKAQVISLILEGRSDEQVALAVSTKSRPITRQAITAFRHRHEAELQQATEAVEKQITDYAIAQKVNRIAALDNRWTLAHQVILARAADPTYAHAPGYSTGLLAHDVKAVGSGEGVDLVDVFKVDTGLLAEIRAMERAAAEELAQLPKPDVHIQNNVVLARYVLGAEPE